MAPKARVQKRLYYKIGEACKALGIQPYVLRYWETEFPALSPSKSRSGQRVYSEKELEVIRRIKQLLYDEGYTIAGAKKKLEGELAAGTLGEPAGAPLTPPGVAAGAGGLAGAAGAAATGSPAAPFVVQGAGAGPGTTARPEIAPAAAGAGAGVGAGGGASVEARASTGPDGPVAGPSPGAGPGGGGAVPIRTVPLPLVPVAPAAAIPGPAAVATSPAVADGRVGRPTLPLEPLPPLVVEVPASPQPPQAAAAT